MSTAAPRIEDFVSAIPEELRARSGKVFYAGRQAFAGPAALYVLGLNPGGDPESYARETVGAHTDLVIRTHPADWSAYRDESWEGRAGGTYGMAPRVLHLFRGLNLAPGTVPCSNLIFVRSRTEADLQREIAVLADRCWPFHAQVMARLRPKVVLCFGGTTGQQVRARLGANTLIDEFVEQNRRGWRSQAFAGAGSVRVVVVSHPSRADWTNPAADPTGLVRSLLA